MTKTFSPTRAARILRTLACLACLALATPAARADVIFNNLNQPHTVGSDYTAGLQVGNALLMGPSSYYLQNIIINEQSFGPINGPGGPFGESFAIYSRTPTGDVGALLFNNFTQTFNAGTGLSTFTANSPFGLVANTGYWLLLISTSLPKTVVWDYTPSTTFTAAPGVTLPAAKNSVFMDNTFTYNYLPLSAGPQLFQVNANAIPEPGPLSLAGVSSGVIGLGYWWRRRRASASA